MHQQRGYGDVDEAAVVRAVQDVLPARITAAGIEAPDPGHEFMQTHSGIELTGDAIAGAARRLAAGRMAAAARTLDTTSVARLLGVHRTRVQHLRQDGALYAYRDGRSNRYPLWQFTDQGTQLPGLREVWQRWGRHSGPSLQAS